MNDDGGCGISRDDMLFALSITLHKTKRSKILLKYAISFRVLMSEMKIELVTD